MKTKHVQAARGPRSQRPLRPILPDGRAAHRREDRVSGVVCFISNYTWLDGLSFTGMRERFLEAFDEIRIDCLNGDKYRTGKTTPDGDPDPSIFSTPEKPVSIQVGYSDHHAGAQVRPRAGEDGRLPTPLGSDEARQN